MTRKNKSDKSFLRTMALIILLVGTIGSLYFMFNAGSNQKSILLLGLFTFWVLSPFVGLLVANKASARWTFTAQQLIYWSIFALTIISLIVYSDILTIADIRPAFIFLVIPLLSWFIILTVWLIAKRISRNDRNKT